MRPTQRTILAIDPGNTESAYVMYAGTAPPERFGKVPNDEMLILLTAYWPVPCRNEYEVILEKVACMGMPVGEDVFETVFWTGRFVEVLERDKIKWNRMKRHEVKMHLCGSARAKDSNIITALMDRFDPDRKYGKYGKGTKKNKGPFYGFSKDVWQAFALAVTWGDQEITLEDIK